jgi:hypothetical protein
VKAKIGDAEVEGTPAEIAELLRSLSTTLTPVTPASQRPNSFGKTFVDENVAFKVLKRRSLSLEQQAVLRTLAKNHPNWTLATELQRVTKYTPNQLAGLLGAFGKRVGSTEGYRTGTWFFEQEWNYETDCNQYKLPEAVLRAVQRAGL